MGQALSLPWQYWWCEYHSLLWTDDRLRTGVEGGRHGLRSRDLPVTMQDLHPGWPATTTYDSLPISLARSPASIRWRHALTLLHPVLKLRSDPRAYFGFPPPFASSQPSPRSADKGTKQLWEDDSIAVSIHGSQAAPDAETETTLWPEELYPIQIGCLYISTKSELIFREGKEEESLVVFTTTLEIIKYPSNHWNHRGS